MGVVWHMKACIIHHRRLEEIIRCMIFLTLNPIYYVKSGLKLYTNSYILHKILYGGWEVKTPSNVSQKGSLKFYIESSIINKYKDKTINSTRPIYVPHLLTPCKMS